MLVNGIGTTKGLKKINDTYFGKCPACHEMVIFALVQTAKKFKMYWIPVATWDKQYYIVCPKCDHWYGTSDEQINKIKEQVGELPNSKLISESWQDVMEYHLENVSALENKSRNDYITELVGHLRKLGYEKIIIDYIIPIYVKNIIELSCAKCGVEMEEGSNFCNKCGTKLEK